MITSLHLACFFILLHILAISILIDKIWLKPDNYGCFCASKVICGNLTLKENACQLPISNDVDFLFARVKAARCIS